MLFHAVSRVTFSFGLISPVDFCARSFGYRYLSDGLVSTRPVGAVATGFSLRRARVVARILCIRQEFFLKAGVLYYDCSI